MTFLDDFALLHFHTYYRQGTRTSQEVHKRQRRERVAHANNLELAFGGCVEDVFFCVRVKPTVQRVVV